MMTRVTSRDMAATLFNIATLLRDRQDSPYRIRAYERGVRALLARRDQIAEALRDADKTLPHRKGVLGERVQRRLADGSLISRPTPSHERATPPSEGRVSDQPQFSPRSAQVAAFLVERLITH